jgi:hypothetical protein
MMSRTRASRAQLPRSRRSADRGHPREDSDRRQALVDTLDGRGDGQVGVVGGADWRAFGLKPHLVDTFKLSLGTQS